MADHHVSIPQVGSVPSMNVAVAGSIAMFSLISRRFLLSLPSHEEIDNLLNRYNNCKLTGVKATSYNYLIDYTEGYLFSETLEGERLINLCFDILKGNGKERK